jgi:hypothetical protein
MASAEREPTRAPARVELESVRDQHLGAGGYIVSLAFWCFHRAEAARDTADWLAGFKAGLRGGNYVYPNLEWSPGSIDGTAQKSQEGNGCQQRLRYLASFRLTPQFAWPLWDWGPWR